MRGSRSITLAVSEHAITELDPGPYLGDLGAKEGLKGDKFQSAKKGIYEAVRSLLVVLALAAAQNGYDYNRPNRPFGQGTSSRPGTSPGSGGTTTTSYPIRPQSDDFSGPSGPTTGYPSGPQNYPGSGGQRPGYPGQGPSGPSGSYPGQSDSSYPQGPRGPSGFPGQGSRYPGQGQNYPGSGSGNNYDTTSFSDSDNGNYEGGDYSAIPGEPDIDYPILSYIPQTSFSCKAQSLPGYYADVDARCQVFHVCSNNITYDFLCPNGTIFSQEDFVCVWWNQFTCESAPGLYELNAKLYDYSIKGSSDDYSSFNDYSGSSYPGGRGPQGPSSYPGSGSSRPSNYPGSSGPSTPYPGIQSTSSYPGSQSPSGGYPGPQGPTGNYPGSQGPSGSYPGSQGPSGGYPSSQGPSGSYPGSQGPSGNYPGYPGSGSGPQGPSSGPSGSGYPGSGSTTPYPGSGSGSQGYPSGRPSGPSFNGGGSRGRPAQKPNREYLPPRN
ncbi:unnamed protein product [Spodoptera littoralis]|uniref:Chitin-binding type-2 domain-containing protein n=1 Tax=Spodoptera littoralis TaxID=7109 RepID=A0A9P0MYN5_SPOLI|nr:unnamed protein product [Spodoptera littoralis]CAH1636124.1 unnamed protein product [Spodoptera littoralis]